MFTKYKQVVERWLRDIITDEVSRVNKSLQYERDALRSRVASFDAQLATLNTIGAELDAQLQTFVEAVSALNATIQYLSEVKENTSLREHIANLNGKFADLNSTIKKLHPRA